MGVWKTCCGFSAKNAELSTCSMATCAAAMLSPLPCMLATTLRFVLLTRNEETARSVTMTSSTRATKRVTPRCLPRGAERIFLETAFTITPSVRRGWAP